MEAVPRLPMIGFDMLVCTKKISFTHKIEKYISGYYHENPSSYNTELQTLDALRNSAVWPSDDLNSCHAMKKYYCQLHYMKSRFPMNENQPVALQFSWKDAYTKMSCTVPDVGFEEMCMLFNIGALHSKLGTDESRSTSDGMKMACTHFQCAAWTFQVVREQYAQYVGLVIANIDIVRAMELLCLAQAQECILEKSLLDNRKAAVVVKVAAELSNYYFKAHRLLVAGDDAMLYEHLPQNKYSVRYVQFKIAYYRSISLLYAGQQAEEQQQMGARVAYYQAAIDALEEARSCINRMPDSSQQQAPFSDTVTFTWDVVEGKRKAAVNENEFIYHEEVPHVTGPGFELKGASLVKGIPFSITDVEVSGPDIFARLIPMVAHEASSIYSEQKASLLRFVAEEIEKKDNELQEFLSAINIDFLNQMKTTKGLTQELVDRAADVNARPEIIKELVEIMSKLSDSYHEIESLLSETHKLIQNEERAETKYQSTMGKRPQSIVLTELHREALKYQEAHNRASDSNDALHKAMTTHMGNLKILTQPLSKLQEEIPCVILPDSNINEEAIHKLETVLAKVEEMKMQRVTLWTKFREEMHKDDITPLLVTTNLDMDDLFETEMKKHKNLADLIKQNVVAQENIKVALTNSYAALNDSRKYIEKILQRRNAIIMALISSYDTYDDLKAKALRGIEFYTKLENNTIKLYQRVRSTCKVQQEEREQLLISAGALSNACDLTSPATDYVSIHNSGSQRKGSKLKDYLDTRKLSRNTSETNNSYPDYMSNMNRITTYSPGIRPAPIGEEVKPSAVLIDETALLKSTGDTLNQNIASRMAQLKIAQEYYDETSGTSSTSAYDHNIQLCSRFNPSVNVVNESYDLSNKTTNPNVHNYNLSSTPIISTDAYGIPTFVTTSEAIDSSKYSYNTTYGINAAGLNTSTITNQPQQSQFEQINIQNNTSHSSNTEALMNTYSFYPSDYAQLATSRFNKDNPAGFYNIGVIENVCNSAGYNYAGYNFQQNNVSSTAPSSYATLNSSSIHNGIPYTSAFVQTNGPVVPCSNYLNSIQPSIQEQNISHGNMSTYFPAANQTHSNNLTAASIIPLNHCSSNLTYNDDHLPRSSTQITATSTTAISSNAISSQCIGSGYSTAHYDNSVAPIRSHANFNTDSINCYGQQPISSPCSNYVCQSACEYNICDSIDPKQSQSTISSNNIILTEKQKAEHGFSDNKISLKTATQSIGNVSSIDLLAGLDFSLKQVPLVPQKDIVPTYNPMSIAINSSIPPLNSILNTQQTNVAVYYKKTPIDKPIKKEPFRNTAIMTKFTKNAQEFCAFTESLVIDKALNALWRGVQDAQDTMNVNIKSISVARCYPLKNRFPDILPYDYSRIELLGAKDDYINASKIYDLHEYVPNFIITQTPLKSTLIDFWDMVWERDVETIVCLLSDSEVGSDIYWPTLQSNELNIGNKVMTLQNTHVRPYSSERKICIHIPEKRETKSISLYQFTSWSGSVLPANAEAFLAFIHDVVAEYDTQKSHLTPILVHCNSGVGRSGCFCTVMSVMGEVNSTGQCVDVQKTICLISAMRKNILKDREHLRFTYSIIAQFYKDLIKVYNYAALDNIEPITQKEDPASKIAKGDPLRSLDPLWVAKKQELDSE